MKSLDTNTLLRLLVADVPEQTAAVEALLTDTNQKFAVADVVFAEIVWVLQGRMYGYGRQQIASNLRIILAIKQIICNRALLETAINRYVDYPMISFIDGYLTAYADQNDAQPLLTFDKKLVAALPNSAISPTPVTTDEE